MSVYSELQSVASGVFKEFRQDTLKLIVRSSTGGTLDRPTSSEVTYDLDGACKGVSFKYVKDGFAVVSDLQVSCAVLSGVTPKVNDFIEVNGIRHKIVHDASVPAAGTQVAWKFIIRRGA